MRIVVLSDSHGDVSNVNRILMSQSKAEVVLFCGDGGDDIEAARLNFPEKMFISVKGNCDWGKTLPITEFFTAEGKKIMLTHGHTYNVKFTYSEVIQAAKSNRCDILLFGHTHSSFTDYDDGLYIMNPGSAHGYNATYGIIDITPRGIVTNILNLR